MSTEAMIAPAGLHSCGRTINLDRLLDEDLVRMAQRGSNAATERLMFLYGPLVRSLSDKFFVLGAEKEDVIQEGFVGLFKAIRNFCCTENASFKCFATLCVTRQIQTAVRDACRSKHNNLNRAASIQHLELDRHPVPLEGETSLEEVQVVRDLISEYCIGLTEFERSVLREVVLGRSYADIGKLLGCPPKSVDNGIQRAKRKIMLNRTR